MYLINKKKIVVTGGSGFIGSCFSKIASNSYKIYIIDKKEKNKFLKDKKIIHIKCNLTDYSSLKKEILKIKPNIIVHLAAQSTIDFISSKKKAYLKDNIIATKNIVKISKLANIDKFIFSSTAAVYKFKKKDLSEKDRLLPNNLYGKTKLKNEKYIIKNFSNSKVNYCILRFFNVCSSDNGRIGELHSPETHLIPKIINAINQNKKIKIYGNKFTTKDGTCIRDYIHIKDIVSGILRSIVYLNKNKYGIFNLGSGKGISVIEIINHCSKLLKKKAKTVIEKKRLGDVGKLVCKISSANLRLKWKPKFSNINKIINDEIKWQSHLKKKNIKRLFLN